MKIHHLSCGSFCLHNLGLNLDLVCHCLLLETNSGLVLVDSGYGTEDLKDPLGRLGISPWLSRAKLNWEQTALAQILKLGFQAQDIRHIVLTHLDQDHVGGLSDFPWAKVHIYEEELSKLTNHSHLSRKWKKRIRLPQLEHNVKWVPYKLSGESWQSFDSVRALKEIPEEILLIPLLGHTSGHCGVAVQTESGYLLHGGDSYYQSVEISQNYLETPLWLQAFESFNSYSNRLRLDNQKKLRALRKDPQFNIFCSHDESEYHRCQR
jgi:glyoxylase-like metal-dependent hydrolase (beta-lactamase superfamily II)